MGQPHLLAQGTGASGQTGSKKLRGKRRSTEHYDWLGCFFLVFTKVGTKM